MAECRIHIAILDTSPVVVEGLASLLMQAEKHYAIHRARSLHDIAGRDPYHSLQVVLAGLDQIRDQQEAFLELRESYMDTAWIGISLDGKEKLPEGLSNIISLQDTAQQIAQQVAAFVSGCTCKEQETGELTEREIEVLALLVQGYSNKDVAEKLFISPHTVITHRKNLVEKTGIRSLSGLTIYAITKNIISLDSLSRD